MLKAKFLIFLMASFLVATFDVATTRAQILYLNNSFASYGYAVTDAGEEYAYVIDQVGRANASGNYTYSESGSAPGYGNSASTGVEHASQLSSQQMNLTGRASAYVGDDYGYGWAYADATVSDEITFRLVGSRLVNLTGSLALVTPTYSSPPTWYFGSVQLLNASGRVIYQKVGTGNVNFSRQLPAGLYRIRVSSGISQELNAAGGDAYDGSQASFNLTLRAQ